MNRVLKTLLLWLLIATLPIQGFAAAMMSCGPNHHESLSTAIMADEHHHDAKAAHRHLHDDAAMSPVADGASSDFLTNKSPGTHKHKSASCSACAACCVGATAPPS